jgi:RNA polymerase sigma-70 factor (ECF subfamily)
MHTLTLPHVSPADEAFLGRVRNADPEAIAEAYDAHHVVLCSFARRLLCDDHAAEDLVQDVFLVLPRLAHRLDRGKSLRSFLLGIAANRARHHLRALARRRRFAERLGREPLTVVEGPERLSERRGLAARLERALETLSFDQRMTFVLREIEGCEAQEVSEILGIPEATVRTRVFHARKKLQTLLAEQAAAGGSG